MIEQESEKIAICPICLESLMTNLFFASDNHLYHNDCFSKINFKTPIARQDLLKYLSVNKVVNGKAYFEK